jgi:UDP-N-acetylmuramoylalanine--D-glutamate ligase
MIDLSPLKKDFGAKALYIVGLGKSGLPVFDACTRAGIPTLLWDDGDAGRAAAVEKGGVLCAPDRVDFGQVAALCLSPGIPLTHPAPHASVILAESAGVQVLGDIELFHRAMPDVKTIGITGTNGKSTTTALIGHVLTACGVTSAVGGNIGEAVLTLPSLPEASTYVLEMSSYQLDLCPGFRPDIGVFINISPDHLDRHGSMDGYIAAKKKIFSDTNIPVIGVDDPWSREVFADISARNPGAIAVSCETPQPGGIFVDTDGLMHDRGDAVFSLAGFTRLKGRHNWQNAALCYAAMRMHGLQAGDIQKAFDSFSGLAHRQMLVAEISGVSYVNDSKATNDQAAAMALKTFKPVYWIAGGKDKGAGYTDCEKHFDRIRHAYLIGIDTDALAVALTRNKVPFTRCGTMDVAVAAAHRDAQREQLRGACVLLSPACASFDQFRSFEHRGDVFCTLVKNLKDPRKKGTAA